MPGAKKSAGVDDDSGNGGRAVRYAHRRVFLGLRIVSARYKMAADLVATLREIAVIRKLGAPVSSQALQFIRNWFETEPGRRLLRRETALIRSQVRRFHGESLLWMGPAPNAVAATARCMIKTRFYLSQDASAARRSELPASIAVPEALPVPSNSVDGVVVHHALEYAEDPRAAIREVTRVIRPGGRLLICAFNPLSLWSLRRPRGMTMVTAYRLSDWLAVLGFDREENVLYMNYRASLKLGFDGERWRQVGDWLAEKRVPLGGVYLVLAAKNAAARTGVGRLTRAGNNIAPLAMPRPMARQ